jgi:hypothetical protein
MYRHYQETGFLLIVKAYLTGIDVYAILKKSFFMLIVKAYSTGVDAKKGTVTF